jgi:hypothetical protein
MQSVTEPLPERLHGEVVLSSLISVLFEVGLGLLDVIKTVQQNLVGKQAAEKLAEWDLEVKERPK